MFSLICSLLNNQMVITKFVLYLFLCYLIQIHCDDTETIADTLEEYFSAKMNHTFSLIDDVNNINISITDITPILSYQNRTFNYQPTVPEIIYTNLEIIFICTITFNHNAQFTEQRRITSMQKYHRLLLKGKIDRTYFYSKPIMAEEAYINYGDLQDYLFYSELIKRINISLINVFQNTWEQILDSTLVKYPKTAAQYNFEYLSSYIEQFGYSFCCKRVKVKKVKISNIKYGELEPTSYIYGRFYRVSMHLSYIDVFGIETNEKVIIDSIIVSGNTISVGKPIEGHGTATARIIVSETFEGVFGVMEWEAWSN